MRSEGPGTEFPPPAVSTRAGKHSWVEGRTRNMRDLKALWRHSLFSWGIVALGFKNTMKIWNSTARSSEPRLWELWPWAPGPALRAVYIPWALASLARSSHEGVSLPFWTESACFVTPSPPCRLTEAKARRENKACFPWPDLSGDCLWTFILVFKWDFFFCLIFSGN